MLYMFEALSFHAGTLCLTACISTLLPIPVAEQSKVWDCSRSPAGITSSNPTGGMDVCVLWVLCVCQVEVSATGWSLVQRSPTDCGASLCVISKP
jgi:hypothetical protein